MHYLSQCYESGFTHTSQLPTVPHKKVRSEPAPTYQMPQKCMFAASSAFDTHSVGINTVVALK